MSDGFGNALAMSRLVPASADELRQRHGDAFLVIQGRMQRPDTHRIEDPTHDTVKTIGVASSSGSGPVVTPARGLVYVVARKPASTFAWVSVGRHENNDVHIPHASVSRFHALLRDEAGTWVLQDAKSANGTFADGAAVVQHGAGPGVALRPGSQVRFGEIVTVFLDALGLLALAARTSSRDAMPGVG